MAVYRAAIAFPQDSSLPRDELSINPHFSGDDAQALANALKANLIAHASIAAKPFKIKVYDAEKAPPSYPLATAEQAGTPPTTGVPREITLCLSYYGTWNRPTFRGRLYLPFTFIGGTVSTRPTVGQQNAALSAAAVFKNGLPSSHQWVVWSRKNRTYAPVTNYWVDDEWDIQRSRGLKPTSRVVGTVP